MTDQDGYTQGSHTGVTGSTQDQVAITDKTIGKVELSTCHILGTRKFNSKDLCYQKQFAEPEVGNLLLCSELAGV